MESWCSDQEEDDWYYDSLARYGKLIMFEIEDAVQQIELSNCSSICVLSKRKSGQCVISELLLPLKLRQSPPPLEGLIKDRDLKIKSGTYVDNPTSQIVALYGRGKVFASQEGINGVSIYKLSTGDSDRISKDGGLNIPIQNPRLALIDERLLLSKFYSEPAFVVDTNTGEIVYKAVPKPSAGCVPTGSTVTPFFLSNDVFGLCQESTGVTALRDIRQDSCIGLIEGDVESESRSWTVAGSMTQNLIMGSPSSKIGLLSDEGHLKIYDSRCLKSAETFAELEFKYGASNRGPLVAGGNKQLRFDPSNNRTLSVSGFDENVYIYEVETGNRVRSVFVHDGHVHTENCDKQTVTTSHLWYEPGGDSVLISGAENYSINCWQYNAEKS